MSTSYDVINPATEQIVKNVPHLDLEQTDAIIVKAAKAFETWKNVTPLRFIWKKVVTSAVFRADERISLRDEALFASGLHKVFK